jgi:hypothetical protein
MIHQALEYEFDRIKYRFDYAFDRLKDFAEKSKEHSEIIYRILTTRVLYDAMGALGKHGYHSGWDGGPLARMEFLVHFIGHELLDDGDPGLGWHKYNDKTGEMDPCAETDIGAKPYWHRCHEMLPFGSKHLYEKEVIWVLDWHEKYEEKRYKFHGEETKPEDPLLVELAKSIVGK